MQEGKAKVRVSILVDRFRIVGNIESFPGACLMDLVKSGEGDFVPVTDAEIYNLADGKLLHSPPMLGVNMRSVNLIYPIGSDFSEIEA